MARARGRSYTFTHESLRLAHYTAPEIIEGIYDALARLGVGDDVRILEPAAGIGHFAGIRYYNLDRNHAANGELSPVRYEQMTEKKVSCLT